MCCSIVLTNTTADDIIIMYEKLVLEMKKCICLIFAVLFCLSLVSCSEDTESDSEIYYSFSDSEGREVTLNSKPKRVAVLFSSYAEMWTLAGGEVALTVGESVERGFAAPSVTLADAGAGKSIDREVIVASNPDLVIASADIAAQAELAEYLGTIGIPCALLRVDSFYDYASAMEHLCAITGRQDLYEKNVLSVREEIDNIIASVPKTDAPRILFVRCGSGYGATKAKTSDENFVCKMLSELGAVNIADEALTLCDGLSLEAILMDQPEKLLLSTMGSEAKAKEYMNGLLESEPWQALGAAREGNYVYLDKNLFQFKPNARWAEAYKFLAEYLYGEN